MTPVSWLIWLLTFVAVFTVKVSAFVRVNLTEAYKNNGAKCLDGSIPVFFWRRGHGSGFHKFLVFFHGGSWCSGLDKQVTSHMDDCVYRTQSSEYGTSETMPEYGDWKEFPFTFGFLSPDPRINPAHHDWNTVVVWYCDGTSFTGDLEQPLTWLNTSDNSTTVMNFRGWRIIQGLMDTLMSDRFGLREASSLVVSGGSAGALAAMYHGDWIIDYSVQNNRVDPSQLRKNSGIFLNAGWFLYYESAANFTGGLRWIYDHTGADHHLNRACVSNLTAQGTDPFLCMFPEFLSPFVQAPLYALQSRFDSFQIGAIGNIDSHDDEAVNEFGEYLQSTFESTLFTGQMRRAGYLDSCYNHVSVWQNTQTNGSDPSTVDYSWVVEQPEEPISVIQELPYPCDYCCSIT